MSNSSAACVDASLVVRLLVGPEQQKLRLLWERWTQENRDLVAPALIHYEIVNALYQYERHGRLSSEIVTEAFKASTKLPIRLYSDTDLNLKALLLARRFALPACYDAHYLALAEHLGVELWTCDDRLVKKVGTDFPSIRPAL
jgi:predicted nucleic acid-binding protein